MRRDVSLFGKSVPNKDPFEGIASASKVSYKPEIDIKRVKNLKVRITSLVLSSSGLYVL